MAKARKNLGIYLLWFIAASSDGYETDFNLDNTIATLPFYFFGKKIRQQTASSTLLGFHCLIDAIVINRRR